MWAKRESTFVLSTSCSSFVAAFHVRLLFFTVAPSPFSAFFLSLSLALFLPLSSHCDWWAFFPHLLSCLPPAACGFVFYVNWDTHAHAQLFEQARRKRKRKENKRASIGLPFKSGITQEWRTFSLSVCLRVDLILCVLNSFSSLFLFLFCFPFSYYVSGLSFSLSLSLGSLSLFMFLCFSVHCTPIDLWTLTSSLQIFLSWWKRRPMHALLAKLPPRVLCPTRFSVVALLFCFSIL